MGGRASSAPLFLLIFWILCVDAFLNLVIIVTVGLNSLYCGYNCHFLSRIFEMKADVVRSVAVSSM